MVDDNLITGNKRSRWVGIEEVGEQGHFRFVLLKNIRGKPADFSRPLVRRGMAEIQQTGNRVIRQAILGDPVFEEGAIFKGPYLNELAEFALNYLNVSQKMYVPRTPMAPPLDGRGRV